MKKMLGITVTLATIAVFCSVAMAADTVATVTGKVSVANNVPSIAVTAAKDASGKALADLAGKTLTVIGEKAADVAKLNGKTVEATGALKENNTKIEVTNCKEVVTPAPKPAPAK